MENMQNQPVILYVEDEAHSRRVMQMLLRGRMNLPHLTIFENSSDFLKRATALEPKPDVIFLDIHVQPYDGFAMLKLLRQSEHFNQARIVALTASVMHEEVKQLQLAGFDGCLGKPIDIDTFPDMLKRIVQGEHLWNIVS